jgi:hypothetical protein
MKPTTRDDLKRYRDAGLDEIALVLFQAPNNEREMVTLMEEMAREYVEPAAKL